MAETKFGFQIGSALATQFLTDSKYIRGGQITVKTLDERNALPVDTGAGGVVIKGSLCYVQDESKLYQYDGSAWNEFKAGGDIPSAGSTATAIGSTASGGSASTWSRSDHVHNIVVATGDSNGQIKIAGQNVSVKGLGSAAYTNTSAYAAASHTHTSNQISEPRFQSSATLTTRTLFHFTRADRLMFLPADQIIIEQSTDAGATWTSAGYTDAQKTTIFSGRNNGTINIPKIDGAQNTDCMLRITITGMKYNVPEGTAEIDKYQYWNSTYVKSTERYCQLHTVYFWLNSISNRIWCQIDRATGAAPNNWVKLFDTSTNANYIGMSGWSGMDFITFSSGVFGGSTGQTGNYWNYRITLRTCTSKNNATEIFDNSKLSTSYTTSTQGIMGIMGYGDTVWVQPNSFMGTDHIYSWDTSQNTTFPANVAAKSFTENGTALSAKYLSITGKAADSSKLNGATIDDTSGGLSITNNKIQVSTGNGLSITNNQVTLQVTENSGLSLGASGLSINLATNSGLTLTNNQLSINVGNGLTITDNKLDVTGIHHYTTNDEETAAIPVGDYAYQSLED